MSVYQINYDLRKQKDYSSLIERIKSYGTWCHPLESVWIIVTNQTAPQVRDYLTTVMDRDDGILVTRLQGEAAWYGLSNEVSQWIQSNL
ncbi:hypothetical protein SAMN05518863_109166 [Candidatus Pantoea symbiotica]|uniref:SinR family protein n=1 Tax=Candidatus Pantoea symbiotica TaxID=1884370 RepID=A0A1I4BWT1_9GAMM|nr:MULTISPECIES: hypothetical protein [Pantoea]SFK72559.1 hypothetical protein SAMN05518863_109166 [Pantoea symbiotica]SFV00335.1 hypothetical protein SAMN05518864_109166 [Pantoea sp. YR525]